MNFGWSDSAYFLNFEKNQIHFLAYYFAAAYYCWSTALIIRLAGLRLISFISFNCSRKASEQEAGNNTNEYNFCFHNKP
ncbi:hypothetical protein ALV80_03735 [Lactobacillus helveticus]|uniref:Uncharacterized protein n=1 Tax=Lactobacillus helveticus TaxID=1587 RepID=A0AAC8ZXL1_LACHE|nr:hypothetical protein ALV80_03735 [Lactobacillus helveticus]